MLIGRGDGTFEPARDYPVGLEPTTLGVGYVAGDTGFLDLGTVNRSSDDITELFGLPGGNFVTTTIKIPGITPSAFISGDFNGDGQSDLIIGDERAGMIYVSIDPVTHPTAPLIPIDVGFGKIYSTSADLYHDGEDDLIMANADTGVVTILSGWANNTFKNRYTFDVDATIAGLSVVDLNKDGLPDILITEAGTGQIETYLSGWQRRVFGGRVHRTAAPPRSDRLPAKSRRERHHQHQ